MSLSCAWRRKIADGRTPTSLGAMRKCEIYLIVFIEMLARNLQKPRCRFVGVPLRESPMNRSLVRAAACTLAAAALILVLLAVPASSPSQAASFTFSGSNCTSFSWDASSNTLTCNSSSPGTFGCSISASPSASTTLTTAVTLTANCSNQAVSIAYTWTAAANAAGCPSIASGASQETLTAPGGTTTLSCGYNLSANDG